jgi:hypothetical protein
MADRRLTDLELERWLAGDLPEPRRRAATDADRSRLEELRAEHAAFLGSIDLGAELRAIDQRVARAARPARRFASWQWAVSGGALAALAATVALVIFMRRPPPRPEDDLRFKGDGVALVVHAASAAGSRRLATGDTVRPGDRVRFEVSVPRHGYVAVVGIDGTGAHTVYYPPGALPGSREPAEIDPRSAGVLPGAFELDDTPGDERFYAVYAERPFPVGEPLFAGLDGGSGPADVAVAQVVLHKKPAHE